MWLISLLINCSFAADPSWVSDLPQDSKYIYVVGEAKSSDKDEALELAWSSALVRIGMTQFPELSQVSSESKETLTETTYNRQFVSNLQYVQWAGLQEAAPPAITPGYTVRRLLKWSRKAIASAKAKIKQRLHNALPKSPEQEMRLAKAVSAMIQLGTKIEAKAANIGKVLKEVKCGVTVDDLGKILGAPDILNINVYSPSIAYWGTYEVSLEMNSRTVQTITAGRGHGKTRYLCNN